jgi:hypothetical protein
VELGVVGVAEGRWEGLEGSGRGLEAVGGADGWGRS